MGGRDTEEGTIRAREEWRIERMTTGRMARRQLGGDIYIDI